MSRPVLVKLGGSVLTDKAREASLQRPAARRLVGELAKSRVPAVLLHGAGSFGHPQALRAGFADGPVQDAAAVSHVLASVGRLHAEVVALAEDVGLNPVSLPLHALTRKEGDMLTGLPVAAIETLLAAGHTPVLCGTVVPGDEGWSVVGADEALQQLAEELRPRLALFVTDVDGIYDRDPEAPGATRLDALEGTEDADRVAAFAEGPGEDVTGRMRGKLLRALTVAEVCPVRILNGTVRGRLLDALKGKGVPCTRIGRA